MFVKTQYLIEEKRSFVPGLRETYEVKDINGNLLGYVKKQRVGDNFWFEGTDGTRMGEIRYAGAHRYEVYDAQNQLRGTIRPCARSASEQRRWRLGFVLLLSGIPLILLGLLGLYIGVHGLIPVGIFGGMALGFSGLIYFLVMAAKGEIGMPEWQIEDTENQKLTCMQNQIMQNQKIMQKQILTPDGDVLAQIQRKLSLVSLFQNSWSINISRQDSDPILILSYTVLMAHRSKPIDQGPVSV